MTNLEQWIFANGLTIKYCGPYDGFVYWSFFRGSTPVGRPFRVIENTTFTELLSPVFLAVSGPVNALWSIGGQAAAGISGDKRLGTVVKVAKVASGSFDGAPTAVADDASNIGESAMFDDFSFDPFDYSDGEAFTAFSDAENVDYGFDLGGKDFDWGGETSWNWGVTGEEYGSDTLSFGTTAESDVSDYGTIVSDTGFTQDDFESYVKGLNVAQQVKKAVSPNDNRQTATGGGTKYSQTAASVSKTIAQATGKSQGSAPSILNQIGGVLSQIETALPRNYTGQLGVNKTGVSAAKNNTMFYIGAGLIGVGLVMYMRKG